jgi:hypothetical protein
LNEPIPDYQLFFYEPSVGTDYDGRVEIRKQAKFQALWNEYLKIRDEMRATQQSFDAHVMLRKIIASARRSIETGEPMDYTINGYIDPLESDEAGLKRKRPVDFDATLEETIKERRKELTSDQLSAPRGGRKTRRSKKSNKRKTYKRKTNKRKISKKKSRKSKK